MFNTRLSLYDYYHDDGLLNDIFYTILPNNLFKLELTFFNRTHYTEEGRILVQSRQRIQDLLHEVAHVIETPNARLFTENFGLIFAKAYIQHITDAPTFKYYKTDIPFKRELRVFGIQYALLNYVRYLGVSIPQPLWDYMYRYTKASLVEYNGVRRPYMTDDMWKSKTQVYKTVSNQLYTISEKYRHDKDYLWEVLGRKFRYIISNKPRPVYSENR